MILSEESPSKTAGQEVSNIHSPDLRFLDSKKAVTQANNASAIAKAPLSLPNACYQPPNSAAVDQSPLASNELNATSAPTEKKSIHPDSKDLHTNSLATCMLQMLRTNTDPLNAHGLRYMLYQKGEPNVYMADNKLLISDTLPHGTPPSMPGGIGTGMNFPLLTGTDILPTPSLSQHCQSKPKSANSTNLYFQFPGFPNLTLIHNPSSIISSSNDLLHSNRKQTIASHYPPLISFNNINNQNQIPMVPRPLQFAESQNVSDQNVSKQPIALFPPTASFPCIKSPLNIGMPEDSEAFSSGSTGLTAAGIRKWNTDDELAFFRLILCYNGTKYTKFAKNFPNKPIKSLNNKWQIEKKRAQKNMYLDWKTVIVSLLCKYLNLLEQSREEIILRIRNALTTVLSSIDPAVFDTFDKSNHAHYSRVLFKSICEMLGDEQLKFLDIDIAASSV